MTFIVLPGGFVINMAHVVSIGWPNVHVEGSYVCREIDFTDRESVTLDEEDSRAIDWWIAHHAHAVCVPSVSTSRDEQNSEAADEVPR